MRAAKVMLGGASVLALLFLAGCGEESSDSSQSTLNQQTQPPAAPTVPTVPQPAAGAPAPAPAATPTGFPAAGGMPATEDPSCPRYVGEALGMPVDLPGCCMPEGVCGVISSLSMMCITSSLILTDLVPGPACTP